MSGPSEQPWPAALLVEAFSERACAGNGAAVVRLQVAAEAAWMQAVARSLNQSETAFLLPAGEGRWSLRWFTPTCEVHLCGHATLAALLALAHWGELAQGDRVVFHTRTGPLPAALDPNTSSLGTIQLPCGSLQPANPPASLEALLEQGLGAAVEAFWQSAIGYGVALLPAAAPLASMAPLGPELAAELRRGLVLMQPLETPGAPPLMGGPADYQLRFFAPDLGIAEDPVTGSAHALVAPYWCDRLGREQVRGWQCSDRPGGMLCRRVSSGMIALTGSGHVLWDGCLRSLPMACAMPSEAAGWPCAEEAAS